MSRLRQSQASFVKSYTCNNFFLLCYLCYLPWQPRGLSAVRLKYPGMHWLHVLPIVRFLQLQSPTATPSAGTRLQSPLFLTPGRRHPHSAEQVHSDGVPRSDTASHNTAYCGAVQSLSLCLSPPLSHKVRNPPTHPPTHTNNSPIQMSISVCALVGSG